MYFSTIVLTGMYDMDGKNIKVYKSIACKWLAVIAIVGLLFLTIGIVFIVTDVVDVGLQIGATAGGGMMGIFFLLLFLAEKSRSLLINKEKMVLPRGVKINGQIVFKTTIVKLDDISNIEGKFYRGDGIFTKDTDFYTIKLKNSTRIEFRLSDYGKCAEKEILYILKNRGKSN